MPRRLLIWIGIALASTLILLSFLVGGGHADSFDLSLRQTLLELDPPMANSAWRVVTSLGSGMFITMFSVVCILVFALRAQWRTVTHLIVVMAGAVIIENTLKYLVHRQRPDELFAHTMPPTYSFPSGHAVFAFAFYVSVALILAPRLKQMPRVTLWAVAISLVILIGASRIFLGVHYPTDVLGGFAAAALWLILVHVLTRRKQQGIDEHS